MAAFESAIAKGSAVFDQRRAEMLALVDQMRRVYGRAAALSEKRRPRFQERGQLTPRDRLSLLLDQGLPWLELYPFANYLAEDPDPETSVPGASVLAGIGFVSGARVMVLASDSGINAGAMGAMASAKMQRCMDMALRHKLPLIHLIESAGANLMTYTVEMWAEGGGLFARLARLSAAGVPTVAVLHGPSTAGGAYYPGMSDYVIGVRGWGQASLGGAALVKAATGEDADEEDLAGVDMHATVSGLVEYVAEDDAHALCLARQVVADLDWNAGMAPVFRPHAAPVLDADDLAGVVPVDYREAYDVRDVFARILDGSAFTDFKPGYGATMVCTKGAIHGHAVGILGNNGPIDNQGATKAAQFMQLCDQAGHPLVFLHNITGYMVGTATEQGGMIKHGSKMIQAAANVSVPKLSLYIGASFGAGNYGMAGHAYDPDFLFAWPNARTGVMGGAEAATTMEVVARAAAARRGTGPDEDALAQQRLRIEALFGGQEGALYTSGRMLDMGVIDPRDSRNVLGFALAVVAEGRARRVRPNSFGVARM